MSRTLPGQRRDCACPKATHRHGTARAYQADRCRCLRCAAAYSRYQAHKRHRTHRHGTRTAATFRPAAGTMRRLQALAVLGWAASELAARLGVHEPNVLRWRAGSAGPMVTVATHRRVAALYEGLWDQPSTGRYARKVRNLALAHGWAPPAAWDDADLDDPTGAPAIVGPTPGPRQVDPIEQAIARLGSAEAAAIALGRPLLAVLEVWWRQDDLHNRTELAA